jgi:hypothetical protein
VLKEDFQRFRDCMRRLEGIYSKQIPDDVMQAYWGALKDLPFELVRERIDSHIRYGKFFPKPQEIRPKEERPKERNAAGDAAVADAEKSCIANLEELRREDPVRHRAEVQLRYCDRILATRPADSPEYAEALETARKLRPVVRGF